MKKKYIIAVVIAVLILVFAGCLSSGAQAATHSGCVTRSEYRHLRGEFSPSIAARKFGTRGQVIKETIEHLQNSGDPSDPTRTMTTIIMTVRYDKCHHWGARKFVKIAYAAWWTPDTQRMYTESELLNEMIIAWRRA